MNCTLPREEDMKMREQAEKRLGESQRLRGYSEAETKEKSHGENAGALGESSVASFPSFYSSVTQCHLAGH